MSEAWAQNVAIDYKTEDIIDFERAQESMREIPNLIDAGLVHGGPINVLAALAPQMIGTGHVRGKLVLKVAELLPNNLIWESGSDK